MPNPLILTMAPQKAAGKSDSPVPEATGTDGSSAFLDILESEGSELSVEINDLEAGDILPDEPEAEPETMPPIEPDQPVETMPLIKEAQNPTAAEALKSEPDPGPISTNHPPVVPSSTTGIEPTVARDRAEPVLRHVATVPQRANNGETHTLPSQKMTPPGLIVAQAIKLQTGIRTFIETAPAAPRPDIPVDAPEIPAPKAPVARAPENASAFAKLARVADPPAALTQPEIETEPDPEIDTAALTRSEAGSQFLRETGAPPPPTATRADMARVIAGQMAAVIAQKPGGGGVEITLNPEELGRVSIVLNGREDGMQLFISVERPETLDLMRRHIAILETEFQALGYGGLSLNLGTSSDASQERDQEHDNPDRPSGGNETLSMLDSISDPATPTRLVQGLDLRL